MRRRQRAIKHMYGSAKDVPDDCFEKQATVFQYLLNVDHLFNASLTVLLCSELVAYLLVANAICISANSVERSNVQKHMMVHCKTRSSRRYFPKVCVSESLLEDFAVMCFFLFFSLQGSCLCSCSFFHVIFVLMFAFILFFDAYFPSVSKFVCIRLTRDEEDGHTQRNL